MGMTWASQKQFRYLLGFIVLAVLFVGVPAFLYFYNPPSCADGVQNGLEEGIDCGGDCPVVCSFRAADPIVHWSRLFAVAPGLYTVVALVENPNISFATDNVPYTFKLRDSDNVLVYERKGTGFFPARSIVPIFETGIRTGERAPARVDFELLRTPVWTESDEWESGVSITSRVLENETEAPRLTATIKNDTLVAITALPVVAVLFDAEGNALQASRTVIDTLPGSAEKTIVFTWPTPFSAPVARIEITPIPTVR